MRELFAPIKTHTNYCIQMRDDTQTKIHIAESHETTSNETHVEVQNT